MKKIIFILIIVFTISNSYAQSKKEIIQELTIENTNLKKEMASLNDKISSLNTEIASLKKELVIDKIETPQDYGKTLFDLFVSQRLIKYPELQFQLKDSVYFSKESFNESINSLKNNALEFYLESNNKGIDWTKAKFDRVEFETGKPNKDVKTFHLTGKIFFTYDRKEYSFRNYCSILENGKWRGYVFDDLVNVTEELENEKKEEQERLNEPYVPRGVKFGGVVYSYNSKEVNPKTMYDLTIPIENNTRYTIEEIKFQFRIYENEKLIFSKNITVGEYLQHRFDSKLEPGEKEIIELNDIDEVYIGSGVKNNKWTYDVELLEVKPKPSED
jgi:hypothetical protein